MAGSINKQCPRCQCFFDCNANSISNCQCSGIKISSKQVEYIKARFDDCLCRDCLDELAREFSRVK